MSTATGGVGRAVSMALPRQANSTTVESMNAEIRDSDIARRAAIHRALGDEHRLLVVDALQLSDHTPTELRRRTGLSSNLLAFHLGVLESAGLVTRTRSQGDARRRYVTLCEAPGHLLAAGPRVEADLVAFVCTANSARSQLAARLWADRTGRPALSGGTEPADHVHPLAVRVARRHGLDLGDAVPRHVDQLEHAPQLVVSVCDRAREAGPTPTAPQLHWSVPDPAGGDLGDFERAFDELSRRVDRLASATCEE